MKRMIDNGLVSTDNGTAQIGKDLEVGGKIHVNQASDIIDKNGKPIAGGGGADWKMYSALVDESKILMYEIQVHDETDWAEGFGYFRLLSSSSYYGVSVGAEGGTSSGVVSISFSKNEANHLWTVSPTHGFVVQGSSLRALDTSLITCTITRVLVNE